MYPSQKSPASLGASTDAPNKQLLELSYEHSEINKERRRATKQGR